MVQHRVKLWLTMSTVVGVAFALATAGHAAERGTPGATPSGKSAPRKPTPADKDGGPATDANSAENSSAAKAAGELADDDSSNGKSVGKKKNDKIKKKSSPKGMKAAKPNAAKRPDGAGNAGTLAGGQRNAVSGNGIEGET